MGGLSEEQKELLVETWNDHHAANSKEITLRTYPRTGASTTWDTPQLGAPTDTAIAAQLFFADDRRVRGLFGDEMEATLVAELSAADLADAGVSPAIHDENYLYRFVIEGAEYDIASDLPSFEQIGEDLVGVRVALKEMS